MGLTQTGTTISVPHMLQEQIDHLTFIVGRCLEAGWTRVEATADAESVWQREIEAVNELGRPFASLPSSRDKGRAEGAWPAVCPPRTAAPPSARTRHPVTETPKPAPR